MSISTLVRSVREASVNKEPIVRSLLDIDFYKFTMGFFIWHFYKEVTVKFSFINRHVRIPVAKIVDEQDLRRELDHVRTLMLRRTDIIWLRGQDYYGSNLFPDAYLKFLSELRMCEYKLMRVGDQYELTFEGPWSVVTFWETIALAIISQLFYVKLMKSMSDDELFALYSNASLKLRKKLLLLKDRPSIFFADFSQRRRHSFLWQRYVISLAKEVLERRFTGTSNAWMAFNLDLPTIGTNAHELPMVLTALASTEEARKYAQYLVLSEWQSLFDRGGLRIVLPDTYGSSQFFENMPEELAYDVAYNWRGVRLDSGDPIKEAELYLSWLKRYNIDPIATNKIVIPSDGLDVKSMLAIDDALVGRIAHPFGWGTNFGNDFAGCHPRAQEEAVISGERLALSWDELFSGHSFVCKVTSANGRPCVKLSNNTNKATGDKEEVQRYIELFGEKNRAAQEVFV